MSRWKKIKDKDARERIYKHFTDNDFVQVVRCKDCECFRENKDSGACYCDRIGHQPRETTPDDYCSRATKWEETE